MQRLFHAYSKKSIVDAFFEFVFVEEIVNSVAAAEEQNRLAYRLTC